MQSSTHKIIFRKILPYFLYTYERYIKYRIVDAWGFATLLKIKNKGSNVRFQGYSRIINAEKLIIGKNVRVGMNCYFHALGGIKIGDNTILSRNITIYSANHNFENDDFVPYDNKYNLKEVIIGNGVWIGMNVSIIPGITIGDGAIIAMGSIVTKNVGKGEIVGNPSIRVLKNRGSLSKFYESQNQGLIYSKVWPNL